MTIVSVILPVRNGGPTIEAQLRALASARKPAAELDIVIADNGSTDDTVAVVTRYADRLPVRVVDCSAAPGINVARNCGVRAARGEWLLFCDADDEVDAAWLCSMCDEFAAARDLVAGPIDYRRLNPVVVRAWRGADAGGVTPILGFLPSGHGANFGVSRAAFDAVGGFDEQFRSGYDDIDFMWRVQLAGYPLHVVPSAVVHYRLRSSLGALWRQSFGYGRTEPLLFRKFSRAGLRRRPAAAAARDLWWVVSRLPFAVPRRRRGAWLRRVAQQTGRLAGAVAYRTWWW